MNKFQKAESRRIKRFVRNAKARGGSPNYKAVRRLLRAYERCAIRMSKLSHDAARLWNYEVRQATVAAQGLAKALKDEISDV